MRAIRADGKSSPSVLGALTPSLVARPDGAFLVRSAEPLPAYPRRLGDGLRAGRAEAPDRVFLAERNADRSWRKLAYAETLDAVTRIAAALLKFDLSPERPIVVLSGNNVEHALIGLAAMEIGVPYCPISPPYALASQDFAKLRFAFGLLTPGLVYATDGAAFARAFNAVVAPGFRASPRATPTRSNGLAFADLVAAQTGVELERARARRPRHDRQVPADVRLDRTAEGGDQHPAHDLRQSGDARPGVPVPRLGAAGAARLAAVEPHLRLQPQFRHRAHPRRHVSFRRRPADAGRNRGDGRQSQRDRADRLFQRAERLRGAAAASRSRRPLAREVLQPAENAVLRRGRPGAGDLPRLSRYGQARDRPRHAVRHRARRDQDVAFGADVPDGRREPGNIGQPMAGVELKLAPVEGKLEARVRAPTVMPGYWRDEELTRKAFDEEGFYRFGDGVRFATPGDAAGGFLFDGRIAEDFKLATGTWVSVGPLRAALVSAWRRSPTR